MPSLANKHVLLGVTGGIAAYKSAEVIRRLQDSGASVRVVMTKGGTEFITPLTMQALSGNPVHTELLNTQHNIERLRGRGIHIFGPAEGEQACGDVGPGRMIEPDDIAELTADLFETGSLTGKKVVITAGPTREAIDPVRYISNHSSGKMGYALAEAAAEAGAETILITGPVSLKAPERVKTLSVTSAREMYDTALAEANGCDLFIASAAVADYRPIQVSEKKIKKSADTMTIELVKNPDIVSAVAVLQKRPFTVGFAAETANTEDGLEHHARGKLERKNLDLVIANDVSDRTIGFNSDDNAVLVVEGQGSEAIPKINKSILARQLIAKIANMLQG